MKTPISTILLLNLLVSMLSVSDASANHTFEQLSVKFEAKIKAFGSNDSKSKYRMADKAQRLHRKLLSQYKEETGKLLASSKFNALILEIAKKNGSIRELLGCFTPHSPFWKRLRKSSVAELKKSLTVNNQNSSLTNSLAQKTTSPKHMKLLDDLQHMNSSSASSSSSSSNKFGNDFTKGKQEAYSHIKIQSADKHLFIFPKKAATQIELFKKLFSPEIQQCVIHNEKPTYLSEIGTPALETIHRLLLVQTLQINDIDTLVKRVRNTLLKILSAYEENKQKELLEDLIHACTHLGIHGITGESIALEAYNRGILNNKHLPEALCQKTIELVVQSNKGKKILMEAVSKIYTENKDFPENLEAVKKLTLEQKLKLSDCIPRILRWDIYRYHEITPNHNTHSYLEAITTMNLQETLMFKCLIERRFTAFIVILKNYYNLYIRGSQKETACRIYNIFFKTLPFYTAITRSSNQNKNAYIRIIGEVTKSSKWGDYFFRVRSLEKPCNTWSNLKTMSLYKYYIKLNEKDFDLTDPLRDLIFDQDSSSDDSDHY